MFTFQPAGGRGASVSACAGLTNQLLSWSSHCLEKTLTAIVGDRWTGVDGIPRPVLLTGAKKSHLVCLISFELPMGFQNFVFINKIHPFWKQVIYYHTKLEYFNTKMPRGEIACPVPSACTHNCAAWRNVLADTVLPLHQQIAHCGAHTVLPLQLQIAHCGADTVLPLQIQTVHCGADTVLPLQIQTVYCVTLFCLQE